MDKELEKAHDAYLKEKENVLKDLAQLLEKQSFDYEIILKAINFIKEGEI